MLLRSNIQKITSHIIRGSGAIFLTFILGFCIPDLSASDSKVTLGVVNTNQCIMESKQGKQEQATLTSLQERLASMAQDSEKQIEEMANQFNDPDFMDGLSPEAEKEMKERYQTLLEEQHRYQNQFQQVLHQEIMKRNQALQSSVLSACSIIASRQKLSLIVPKEQCCFSADALDVTSLVLAEMDKAYGEEQAKIAHDMKAAASSQGQEKK